MNNLLLTLTVLFTTTQTLAIEAEVLDQVGIDSEVYNIVLGDVENVDITSEAEANLGHMRGNLVAQMSAYSTKNNVISEWYANLIYLFSRSTCRAFGDDSRNIINPEGSGYTFKRIRGSSQKGYLSDDKKNYHFVCKVSYHLKK